MPCLGVWNATAALGDAASSILSSSLYRLELVSAAAATNGQQKLLLVNKAATPTSVDVPVALQGGTAFIVDGPALREVAMTTTANLELGAFGTGVVVGPS